MQCSPASSVFTGFILWYLSIRVSIILSRKVVKIKRCGSKPIFYWRSRGSEKKKCGNWIIRLKKNLLWRPPLYLTIIWSRVKNHELSWSKSCEKKKYQQPTFPLMVTCFYKCLAQAVVAGCGWPSAFKRRIPPPSPSFDQQATLAFLIDHHVRKSFTNIWKSNHIWCQMGVIAMNFIVSRSRTLNLLFLLNIYKILLRILYNIYI